MINGNESIILMLGRHSLLHRDMISQKYKLLTLRKCISQYRKPQAKVVIALLRQTKENRIPQVEMPLFLLLFWIQLFSDFNLKR